MATASRTRQVSRFTGLALLLGASLHLPAWADVPQASPAAQALAPAPQARQVPGFEEPLVPSRAPSAADETALSQALATFDPARVQGLASLQQLLTTTAQGAV